MSQQQGARLGAVTRRQQLRGHCFHVPAPLLLVGQHVGAEEGVQGRGDAAHQDPRVQEQREEFSVAGGSRLLEEKTEEGEEVNTHVVMAVVEIPHLITFW